MTRRLLNLVTAMSLLLCVATAVAWVRSYGCERPSVTLPAGRWHVGNWRGRVWVIRHAPNDDPSFVRTTVHLAPAGPRPVALIKALVFERGSPWDAKHGMPSVLLSRPYVLVNLPDGAGFDDACGFATATGRLPATVPPLRQYPNVLQAAAVPHWFPAALTAAAPAAWLLRKLHARRRARAGLCPACAYDLRATPGRCPECGTEAGAQGDTPSQDAGYRTSRV